MIFPRHIDNIYSGRKLALWFFGAVVLMKVGMSLSSVFNGYAVASGPDGIPLGAYSAAAAQTVVTLFALLGLSQFMICLLGILALARYRSAIPFMFALLLVEHVCRRLILRVLPIFRTGTPPGLYVNLVLMALMVIGLALSLWRDTGGHTSTAT